MTWTHPAYEAVAAAVNRRTGLSFTNRQDSAELGMRRAMARAQVCDPLDYVKRIASDSDALEDLISELTVGETYFFREPAHFEFIRREILPEVERQRGPQHILRAWSAGCASGEEAYSLAILFEQAGVAERTRLAATDISRPALAKARQGRFGPWSRRGESAQIPCALLTEVGKDFQVADKIRRRVVFSCLNLALDSYPSFAAGIWGMDLILCRNVLIYFDRETIQKTAERFYQTLADGGWLITASGDPPLWDFAPFEVVASDCGLAYRRPNVDAPATLRVEESGAAWLSAPGGTRQTPCNASKPLAAANLFYQSTTPEASGTEAFHPPPAYARGDHQQVVRTTSADDADPVTAAQQVRAVANFDAATALAACARAAARHPLCAELSFLLGVLLLDTGRTDEAARRMRQVIYLDSTLAIAHFTLGAILRLRGDAAGARRAYRNAQGLCAGRPSDEPVPLADGEPAGRLAEVAGAELALLEMNL